MVGVVASSGDLDACDRATIDARDACAPGSRAGSIDRRPADRIVDRDVRAQDPGIAREPGRPQYVARALGSAGVVDLGPARREHSPARLASVHSPIDRDPAMRATLARAEIRAIGPTTDPIALARSIECSEIVHACEATIARTGYRADRPIPDRVVWEPATGPVRSIQVHDAPKPGSAEGQAARAMRDALDAIDASDLHAATVATYARVIATCAPVVRARFAAIGARAREAGLVVDGACDATIGLMVAGPDRHATAERFTRAIKRDDSPAARFAASPEHTGALPKLSGRVKVAGSAGLHGAPVVGTIPTIANGAEALHTARARLASIMDEHGRAKSRAVKRALQGEAFALSRRFGLTNPFKGGRND